jgi:hypothetical protein
VLASPRLVKFWVQSPALQRRERERIGRGREGEEE